MEPKPDLPSYQQPPVIEVVCGLSFKPLEDMLVPHFGLLWSKYHKDYPICQEMPPLGGVEELFDESPDQATVTLSALPPLPRIWFVQAAENGIIQVQRDRFLHNWRKVRNSDAYPRYASVIEMFRNRFGAFTLFTKEAGLPALEVRQCEMTYVNQIPRGEGWESLEDISYVFPDFSWRPDKSRFLPSPSGVQWRDSFILPEKAGRLHASIQLGKRVVDNHPVIRFELTVRGKPKEQSDAAMWKWFDLAHEWIVRGFADLTGSKVQNEIWKRTQ